MLVRKVLIVGGTGAFGQWYARFFSERGRQVFISGRDCAKTAVAAHKTGVNAAEDAASQAAESDLVIISVPPHATPAEITAIAPRCAKGALLMDFSSVKRDCVATLEKIAVVHSNGVGERHPLHGARRNARPSGSDDSVQKAQYIELKTLKMRARK